MTSATLTTALTVRDIIQENYFGRFLDMSFEEYQAVEANHRCSKDGRYRFVGSNPAIPKYGVPMIAILVGVLPDEDGGSSRYEHYQVRINGKQTVMIRERWDGVKGSGTHWSLDVHTPNTVLAKRLQYLS